MELIVQRRIQIGAAIPGTWTRDGALIGFSLENCALAIPAGRYRVGFTVSQRATEGRLWTPDGQHRLPLIENVPGRSGIRIHAANVASELEGCIAGAQRLAGDTLVYSRAFLEPFIAAITAASDAHEVIWIDVRSPIQEGPLNA